MRLIDADALLYEMIGMKDGWLRPPKKVLNLEDLVKTAPTVNPCDECERGCRTCGERLSYENDWLS